MSIGPGFSTAAIQCGLRREAAVEVPSWVPPRYQSDYRIIAADEDEFEAAKWVRSELAAERAMDAGSIVRRPSLRPASLSKPAIDIIVEIRGMTDADLTIKDLAQLVSKISGFGEHLILGDQRNHQIVKARHILFYLLATRMAKPLAQIGRMMKGRDHTSLIHGRNRVAPLVEALGLRADGDLVRLTEGLWLAAWPGMKASA